MRVVDIATHFEKTLAQINIKHVNAGWLVFGDGFSQGMLRAAIKRLCDVVFATLILSVAWPIMLVTALVICIES
ncbi:hypothetical protein ABTK79_19395, partial [Acinetobacter baumannii]